MYWHQNQTKTMFLVYIKSAANDQQSHLSPCTRPYSLAKIKFEDILELSGHKPSLSRY